MLSMRRTDHLVSPGPLRVLHRLYAVRVCRSLRMSPVEAGLMVGIGYTVLVWPWIVRHWLICRAEEGGKHGYEKGQG